MSHLKEVVLLLFSPRIHLMSKIKYWILSLILAGNIVNSSAQKKFYTCHEITADEAHAWCTSFPQIIILDIRPDSDYLNKHIPRAIWVPNDSILIAMSDTIDEDQTVIVYDKSGDESIDACLLLASKGKNKVFHIKDGFNRWEELGYLVKKSKP